MHTFKSAETQKYIFFQFLSFKSVPEYFKYLEKFTCVIFVMHPFTKDVEIAKLIQVYQLEK